MYCLPLKLRRQFGWPSSRVKATESVLPGLVTIVDENPIEVKTVKPQTRNRMVFIKTSSVQYSSKLT